MIYDFFLLNIRLLKEVGSIRLLGTLWLLCKPLLPTANRKTIICVGLHKHTMYLCRSIIPASAPLNNTEEPAPSCMCAVQENMRVGGKCIVLIMWRLINKQQDHNYKKYQILFTVSVRSAQLWPVLLYFKTFLTLLDKLLLIHH